MTLVKYSRVSIARVVKAEVMSLNPRQGKSESLTDGGGVPAHHVLVAGEEEGGGPEGGGALGQGATHHVVRETTGRLRL